MKNKTKNGNAWRRSQSVVCLVLIIIMFVTAFIPLYSIDVEIPNKLQGAVDQIEEVVNDPLISGGEDISIEFPEKLNVNIILFFKAGTKLKDVIKLYNGMLSFANEASGGLSSDNYYSAYSNLRQIASETRDIITDRDFSNTVALGATVFSAFSQSTLLGIIMILMLIMTILLPLSLLSAMLTAILGFTLNITDSEKQYLRLIQAFRIAVKAYIPVLIVAMFDPDINFSLGVIIGLVACIFGFAYSALACRNKMYSADGHTYLNLVQLSSAAETVMFFGLYFSISKSGIIGQYAALIGKRAIPYIRSKAYGEEFLTQFKFIFLAFVALVTLVITLSLLTGLLAKCGGMLSSDKDSNIFAACSSLVFLTAISIAAAAEKQIVVSKAGIVLTVLAFVFSILIILAEVSLKYFKALHCPRLKESEKYAILRGLDVVETEYFIDED